MTTIPLWHAAPTQYDGRGWVLNAQGAPGDPGDRASSSGNLGIAGLRSVGGGTGKRPYVPTVIPLSKSAYDEYIQESLSALEHYRRVYSKR